MEEVVGELLVAGGCVRSSKYVSGIASCHSSFLPQARARMVVSSLTWAPTARMQMAVGTRGVRSVESRPVWSMGRCVFGDDCRKCRL